MRNGEGRKKGREQKVVCTPVVAATIILFAIKRKKKTIETGNLQLSDQQETRKMFHFNKQSVICFKGKPNKYLR